MNTFTFSCRITITLHSIIILLLCVNSVIWYSVFQINNQGISHLISTMDDNNMFENNIKLQNSILIRWESNLDKNMGNDKKIFWVFLSKVNTNCSTSLYMINKENNPQWSLLCNTIHVVNRLIYSTKQMTPNFEVSDKMKSLVERCQIKNICKWKFYHVIETFKKY